MANSSQSGNILGYASGTQPGLVSTVAQTFAGKKTFNTGALISGDSAGTTIPSGYIGYQVRGFVGVGSLISLTNGVWSDIASITLGVGTWDITSLCFFRQVSAVIGTRCLSGIGTTAGNNSTGMTEGDNRAELPTIPTTSSDVYITLPNWRVIITSGTQTYYMKAFCSFSAGSVSSFGRLTGVLVG